MIFKKKEFFLLIFLIFIQSCSGGTIGNFLESSFNDLEKINKVIEKINIKLTLLEKIKKIQLIDENFSIENGLMTPTMKVKRKKVTEKYKNQLENLY